MIDPFNREPTRIEKIIAIPALLIMAGLVWIFTRKPK